MPNGDCIMTIALYNKSDLNLINKKTLRYKLADAEKDYFLAIVSKIIYDSDLKNKIVFKGGTAIHHCYLPQTRFSEDLDFSSLDKTITLTKEIEGLIRQKEVRKSINRKSIFKNWEVAKKEKEFESSRIYYGVNISPSDILSMVNSLKLNINKGK